MELYSHNSYKGYSLFVEIFDDESTGGHTYEGVAQLSGITKFTSVSGNGDDAEIKLEAQIDEINE